MILHLLNFSIMFFRLIIAIVTTVLVSKLNYFKNDANNTPKRTGKRMIIWGVWLYFILRLIGTSTGVTHLPVFIEFMANCASLVVLFLPIIGFVLCVVFNKEKHKETKNPNTNMNLDTDAKQGESMVDDLKLF